MYLLTITWMFTFKICCKIVVSMLGYFNSPLPSSTRTHNCYIQNFRVFFHLELIITRYLLVCDAQRTKVLKTEAFQNLSNLTPFAIFGSCIKLNISP